jgi:hypothetical protein
MSGLRAIGVVGRLARKIMSKFDELRCMRASSSFRPEDSMAHLEIWVDFSARVSAFNELWEELVL